MAYGPDGPSSDSAGAAPASAEPGDGFVQRLRDLRRVTAFSASPVAILCTDSTGVVVDANDAACRLIRGPLEALAGKDIKHLVVPQDLPVGTDARADRAAGELGGSLIARLSPLSGDPLWAKATWRSLTVPSAGGGANPDHEQGEENRFTAVFVEAAAADGAAGVTLDDEVLAGVERERAALTAALDATPDGVAIMRGMRDEDGDLVDVLLVRINASGTPPGRQPAEFAGKSLTEIVPDAPTSGLLDAVVDVLRSGQRRDVLVQTDSGGWRGAYQNAIVPMGGDRVVCTFRDVTAARFEEQRLLHAATHDALTGLPNRALLRDRVAHALRRCSRNGTSIAVAFMDLDGFKVINDSYGHQVGDLVLRHVAGRLAATLRDGETLARLGGDEFVLVLENCPDEEHWLPIYRRVQQALEEPPPLPGRPMTVRASIGVIIANGNRDVDTVLRDADIAMYAAKAAGKSRYSLLTGEQRGWVADRHLLEIDLNSALAEGQFELHYQPVVDLRSRTVVGREALLRWRHPARGLLSPAAFLPAAEAGGLMVELGAWVLRQALSHAAAWRGAPHASNAVVGVNTSAQQLMRGDYVSLVADALAASGLPPSALAIELTESQMLPASTSVLDQLAQLRALGVAVAVDDFGTGYSSLAHLTDLPVDIVKIDRAFVEGLDHSRREAVLRAVVAMVSSLGAVCVAEGVETPEQCAVVEAAGAQQAQGYLLGRPQPAGAFLNRQGSGLGLPSPR